MRILFKRVYTARQMIERLIGDFCLKVTQCLQEVKAERLLSQWAWMDLVDKAGGSSDLKNCPEGMEVFCWGKEEIFSRKCLFVSLVFASHEISFTKAEHRDLVIGKGRRLKLGFCFSGVLMNGFRYGLVKWLSVSHVYYFSWIALRKAEHRDVVIEKGRRFTVKVWFSGMLSLEVLTSGEPNTLFCLDLSNTWAIAWWRRGRCSVASGLAEHV